MPKETPHNDNSEESKKDMLKMTPENDNNMIKNTNKNGIAEKTKPNRSFYRRELPSELIELSSDEGRRRFERALKNKQAEIFFPLIGNLQTQSEPSFCGLTTLATVLNTLKIDPKRIWKFPWRWYSEEMLECCLTLEQIKETGITMDQLQMISLCEGTISKAYRYHNLNSIRSLIERSVRSNDHIVVACYNRKILSQTGSGHFSPIAAYDQESDSVLILDVARFKYSPHWVALPLLLEATKSLDKQSGTERGFLSFQKDADGLYTNEKCIQACCLKKYQVPE